MSSDSKTNVADLSVDASIRWATDQESLKTFKPLIADASKVPALIQQDVSLPFAALQLNLLLEINHTHPSWAMFRLPNNFFKNQGKLFRSSCLLDIFDKEEQFEDLLERIEKIGDQEKEGKEQQDQKKEEERKIVVKMLKTVSDLNKLLLFILGRRNQYQKG